MDDTQHGGGPGGPPPGPPPWIDETIQQQVTWRDGDIVVSVPPKSGTTWTMNIVHQLRSGGDADFADVYAEVPWLEFLPGPSTSAADVVARIDAMPHDRRRAFKTHAPPGPLPYQPPGDGPDVRYVVVVRNPDEAVASMHPFLASHAEGWFALWGMPKAEVVPPDFPTFFAGMGSDLIAPWIFEFVATWWPLRHRPNVELVHYADLKRDPERCIRGLADHLGFEVPEAQWPVILDHTSFSWMKAHEDKFELRTQGDVPILDPGAMIRKGQVGASAEDGVTPEISASIAGIGRTILTDDAAFEWCYAGGPVPA